MDGYFDNEESEQESSENDEWIEVENLLIDEEQTPKSSIEKTDDELVKSELEIDTIQQDTRDETELLLEQLSDLETEKEEVNDIPEVLLEDENILTPDEPMDEPDTVDEMEENVHSPILDIAPEPEIESKPLSELSPEEEVTIKDLMENPNLVTPTFGEILVSQHKFSEARHIFMELLKREPDNLRFLKKVEFLDKFLATQEV
ncbi:MAG: hypothetical protein KAR20_27745, partial [Candidatus Heimdallarchaeota archaeon]|nr:hypothetical protein [Candidatus Heimdallarchaeota archaeon]